MEMSFYRIKDWHNVAYEGKKMFDDRTKAKGYKEWLKYFAEWKFNSDFSKEMSRSANLYIKRFKQ